MSNTAYIKPDPVNIPPALLALNQWVACKGKQPINPRTGQLASPTDPTTWGTIEQALAAVDRYQLDGFGLGFARDGNLAGVDLDHCRNPETGEIEPWAQDVVGRFPRLYWEISLSGTGLHGIGYGALPIEDSGKHPDGIGAFHHSRYFVMTGNVLPGHEPMGDFGPDFADWFHETFPDTPAGEPAQPVTLSLDDHDLIERLRRRANGKAAHLLDGDPAGYTSISEARFALANMVLFYSDDPAQVARILRAAPLWNDKDRGRDRDRKAAHDAQHAARAYSGPRYTPNRPPDPPPPAARDILEPGATCDQKLAIALETIRIKNEELAAARETIARQTARLDAYSVTATAIKHIIASDQIEGGSKIISIALVMEEGDQQKRGKPAAALGRHLPGSWIAKRAGVSVNTANKHLKRLADAGLVERKVVAERVIEDMVDEDTGELIPAGRTISRAYYPDQASALIAKFTSYARPDDAPKHGGTRDLRCKNHPDSPTTTNHVTTCDACQTVLDEHVTHHTPTECKHQVGVCTHVTNSKGDTKLVFALQPPAMPPPGDEEPPDFWTGAPSEPEPWWWSEGGGS